MRLPRPAIAGSLAMHGLAVAGAIWLGSGAVPAGESVVEMVFEAPQAAQPALRQVAVAEPAPVATEATPPFAVEEPPPPAATPVALPVPAVPAQKPRREPSVRPAKAPPLPKAASSAPSPSEPVEASAPNIPPVLANDGLAGVDAPPVAGGAEPAAAATAAAPAGDAIPLLSSEPRFRRPPTPPDYPRRAIDLGQEGEVRVRVRVDAEGASREILVWRSSGVPLLDEAALRAVRKWLFETANVGGRPVESWVEVPVRFRLSRS